MRVFDPGVDWYIEKLVQDRPFSFARYGDGEWSCILGAGQVATAHQRFTPELRDALTQTVTEAHGHDCFLAISPRGGAVQGMWGRIERWIATHAPDVEWHEKVTWARASQQGRLPDLVAAMRPHGIVVVGPRWLRRLDFYDEFIEVRPYHCWADFESIVGAMVPCEGSAISISAGPAAKVLVHRLYPLIGKRSWLLDMGSVWDPYCGHRSRTYQRRMSANWNIFGGGNDR